MKKSIYTVAFLASLLIACHPELNEINEIEVPALTATTESFNEMTKTSMDGSRNILWSKGDMIAYFQGRSAADKYRLTDNTAGSGQGHFHMISTGSSGPSAEIEGSPYIALYPYTESLECTRTGSGSYTIENLALTSAQSHAYNSFGNGSFPMAAITGPGSHMSLSFKNILGAIRLDLTGSGTIKSIKFEGKNGEKLSGPATVTVYNDGRPPFIEMSEASSSSVTLYCGKGVQLSQDAASSFIIALPPTIFSKGFKVTVTDSKDVNKVIQTSASTNEVKRSAILRMPVLNLNKVNGEYSELTQIKFAESEEEIANPERGFYFARSTGYPLTETSIQAARLQNVTVFHIGYLITDYMESDISESFLQRIRNEMQMLRNNGAKCILRFSYKDRAEEADKPWDATPERVARHIKQIRPILQEYGDVIMCFQAGFVGVWGEWYYTSNFVHAPQSPEEHALRKKVTDDMLNALPSDRMIALRTPAFKRMMYAESYTDTLSIATAYNGSARARISCYNDCFGASSSDYGTFDSEESREYWKKESRYVLMGGETCGISDYCTCNASIKDMEDYHWTYLNYDYHKGVIAGWEAGGCMKEIKLRLGYRLHLSEVFHTSSMIPGKDFNVVLKIKNSGFAAPMNGRAVELIMIDSNGKKTVWECPEIDPRYWFAGETATIDKTVKIPDDATGECTMYLNLPDPKPTLHNNPLFSIRLANDNIWMEKDGYNRLFRITVNKEDSDSTDDNSGSISISGENVAIGNEFNPWK